ncbi:hypothetical protein CEXT_10681 [Caerostris extrusa]|uniref:Uncharacterized protein n=1 Tax=Caerostris extrusa TaxID=172846 RepID=A0AAV4XW32_CAEEX|nr:hypothetical protein CEXT_10681 [Caerostris extrusa]
MLFRMTSFGANIVSEENFMATKIQGEARHLIVSLFSENDEPLQFLQTYFLAYYTKQIDMRMPYNNNLNENHTNVLFKVNLYLHDSKLAFESIPLENKDNYQLVINVDKTNF